jgi:Surface-adhesin protein E
MTLVPRGRRQSAYLAGIGGMLAFLASPCYADHWQQIGQPEGAAASLVYVDLDSLREEGGFRVATFLTILANGAPNTHDIKLDRIAQETAFDCAKHTFSLLSTVGYLEGKEAGKSSDKGDWRSNFKPVPQDTFSKRAYDLACKSPLAAHSETGSQPESPGSVVLPGPTLPASESQPPKP